MLSARLARRAGVLLAVVVLSAACSSGGGSSSSTSTTAAGAPQSSAAGGGATAASGELPECSTLLGKPASVWLPVAKGDGCMQGGVIEPAYTVHCKDGSDLLDFGSSPTYFGLSTSGTLAVSEQPISQSSGAYGQLYQRCTG